MTTKITNMAPGQTPYTAKDLATLASMIDGACEDDPGEQSEPIESKGEHHV